MNPEIDFDEDALKEGEKLVTDEKKKTFTMIDLCRYK